MLTAWFTGRAAQFAFGPAMQAFAIVAAMTVTIGLLIGGLVWLRSDAARDARADERYQCNMERALANSEAIEAQRLADRQAAEAAHRVRAEYLEKLDAAKGEIATLEEAIKARPPVKDGKQVVWPRALVKELNR